MENLQIGTLGWVRPEGSAEFYPEDLPAEWQLDYYANAFRVVLVPQTQWLEWDSAMIESCLESVAGAFQFFLAWEEGDGVDKKAQLARIKPLMGEYLGGLVVFSDVWLPPAEIEGVRVSLVSTRLQLPGWSLLLDDRILSGAPFGFLSTLSAEGKAQAALLQSFMAGLPADLQGAPFFIGDESINMNRVADFKVVGELLGY